MTSMSLVFRPSKKVGHNKGSLSLRLIHQRKVKAITIPGCKLYPEEWSVKKQSVIYPKDDPERLAYLEEVELRVRHETEIIKSYVLMMQKQGYYSIDDIVRLYREKKDDGKLSGYVETLAGEMERRGQDRTARAYRTVTRGIIRFNKGVDIPLYEINACLISDFEKHLKETGRMPNTVAYYMRNLRAIYNKAVKTKRITHLHRDNPFAGVHTGVTKTMKRALSLDKVQQLYNLDFDKLLEKEKPSSQAYVRLGNLHRSWRYFFFCFLARGMCFIDLAYLRKENIQGGVIRYCRKKTGGQIEVRVTPALRSLIDSFAGETAGSPYVFPIIKDDTKKARLWYESALRVQNSRLKMLARMAGIEKPVSTHVARHSWATIGKHENVSLRVLSECLGHASENTTLIYLGSLDNSELDNANDIVTSAIFRPAGHSHDTGLSVVI